MLLTLDETTLFYHYRRTPAVNKKLSGVIKNWSKAIEPAAGTRADSSKTGRSASSVRSTSTSTNQTTIGTTPIISDKIDVAADEEAEELEQHNNNASGGVTDEFELDGTEGQFAMLSPVKGKKRVTHDVSSSLYLHCLH